MKFTTALVVFLSVSALSFGQGTDSKAAMAQIKKNLDSSMKKLGAYSWVETTTLMKDGEVKSETKNQCSYGADRKVTKTPISAPAEDSKTPRGVRGKIVENKKEDMSEYVKKCVARVHEYLPPNAEKLQAINAAGKVTVQVLDAAAKKYTLNFPDYLLAGDQVAVTLDMIKGLFGGVMVKTYLEKPDDAINFTLRYSVLPDGTEYPAETIMDLPKEGLKIIIKNDGYKKAGG